MKNTNLLLLLSAALIVSIADVSAMNSENISEKSSKNKRKRESDSQDDEHLNKKVKTGLSQAEQDELDWQEERAYFSEEEEAALWGLKTNRVMLLEDQNESVAAMIAMMDNLSEFISFAENLEEAINRVNYIMEMLNECDINFKGEQDLYPLVVGDDAFLKLKLARKIIEIREKAEALVVVVNNNKNLMINDVSSKDKKVAVAQLHKLLNTILVHVGCQAIDVQIVMNTDEDDNIAQQEYDQEKYMLVKEDEDFARQEHEKYLQAKLKREEDDALLARLFQEENPGQAIINNNNQQADADIQEAIAASLEQKKAPVVVRQPEQKREDKKDRKKKDDSCIIS